MNSRTASVYTLVRDIYLALQINSFNLNQKEIYFYKYFKNVGIYIRTGHRSTT